MYTELRGEVLRCQRRGAEAFERFERAGRDVRFVGRSEGEFAQGQWLAAGGLCNFTS